MLFHDIPPSLSRRWEGPIALDDCHASRKTSVAYLERAMVPLHPRKWILLDFVYLRSNTLIAGAGVPQPTLFIKAEISACSVEFEAYFTPFFYEFLPTQCKIDAKKNKLPQYKA